MDTSRVCICQKRSRPIFALETFTADCNHQPSTSMTSTPLSSGVISLVGDRNRLLTSDKMGCCKPKSKGHYYGVFVNSINPTPEPLVPGLGLPFLVAARMQIFSSFSHVQPLTLLILPQPILSH